MIHVRRCVWYVATYYFDKLVSLHTYYKDKIQTKGSRSLKTTWKLFTFLFRQNCTTVVSVCLLAFCRIWTTFEYSVTKCPEIMRDRHLDQLIMCAIYVMSKVRMYTHICTFIRMGKCTYIRTYVCVLYNTHHILVISSSGASIIINGVSLCKGVSCHLLFPVHLRC